MLLDCTLWFNLCLFFIFFFCFFYCLFFFFFFFQAEDGIRDDLVTGVQTCALPIWLDPKFALAWALLSYTDAIGYSTVALQPTIALREATRQAAETALTLQPNLGEALHAMGYYHYACLKDYDTAVRYFEQARPLLPNSRLIPESLAYVARRRGQWDRSDAYFNEAERLDPRNVEVLTQHALSYMDLRR